VTHCLYSSSLSCPQQVHFVLFVIPTATTLSKSLPRARNVKIARGTSYFRIFSRPW
jgi:hypothetical protein